MTIRKGQQWGSLRPLPPDGVIVRNDAQAARVAGDHIENGLPVPPIGLLGGDLCRTLGGLGDERGLSSERAVTFACDLGVVLLDEQRHYFVAHLVARSHWWRGKATLVMNASWLGNWNAGPRAHPGDALLDCYEADIPIFELAKVRSRLPLGAHLPHPAIRERRSASFEIAVPKGHRVYLDGNLLGGYTQMKISLIPDALTIVI